VSDANDFRVVWRGLARERVRSLGERARACGVTESFCAAVRLAERRLATDPLNWGDPEARLRVMGLDKCHAVTAPLIFYFAVDEERRLVYVNDVKPTPGHPLADEETPPNG
jgi:hypothetical protein